MMGERFRAPVARGQSAFALELSPLLRAKRESEMVRAPMRGAERGYAGLSSLLRAKREPEKHPLLSRRGRHESRATRP